VQAVGEKTPRVISPEGIGQFDALSPDGTRVAAIDPQGALVVYPIDGGEVRPVTGSEPGDVPVAFSEDGGALYIRSSPGVPARVNRLDLKTGSRSQWVELAPVDGAGVEAVTDVLLTTGWNDVCLQLRAHPLGPVRGRRAALRDVHDALPRGVTSPAV